MYLLRALLRRTLTWRLDSHRIGLRRSRPYLSVAHLAAEQSCINHQRADRHGSHEQHKSCISWYRRPSPTHESAERKNANDGSYPIRLVTHLLMILNHLSANSGKSAYRILRRITTQIGGSSGDSRSDENYKCSPPQYVGRGEVRYDEQRQREERSEDRRVVENEMNVCAREHELTRFISPSHLQVEVRAE